MFVHEYYKVLANLSPLKKLEDKNESTNFDVTPLKLNRSQTYNRVEINRSQQQIG